MEEKDRYILLSIVLFVETLTLMILIFCGEDMSKNKILFNWYILVLIINIILLVITLIVLNKNYTGETVRISKEDLHYKCKFESAKEIYIDKNVTNIPYKHFSNLDEYLQYVVFEGENTVIGENAFEKCKNLERVYLPRKLQEIKDETFQNCKNLKSVTIPDSVTRIGTGAFAGCKGLTNITIGSGVKEIGVGVFQDCKKLKSVTISDNVTRIGAGAFAGCKNLKSVTFEDTKGWYYADGTPIDVSSPMENAKKLKESNYNWYKQQN